MKYLKFWNENPNLKIQHLKLVNFLELNGINRVFDGNTRNHIIVKNNDGIVEEIDQTYISSYIRRFLEKNNQYAVLLLFAQNVGNYVNNRLFQLLKPKKIFNDRDTQKIAYMYFENTILQIDSTQIVEISWQSLKKVIWSTRVIEAQINLCYKEKGQFEKFCFNIANQDKNRFNSLKTIIGYLLHRYQDPSNTRAVILLDEEISHDGSANGRRGKSLLCTAISKCREVVRMNGKSIKTGSYFKNQRIERTTDILWYDDVRKDFSLEGLYDAISSGIAVEKKHKPEFFIQPKDAPKMIISSNYIVKGTGGISDSSRRCEFELSSHYSETHSPLDEFGNRFFTEWNKNEWNLFYSFMATCIQEYLLKGLILAAPINLEVNRITTQTTPLFVDFYNEFVEINEKNDKRELLADYRLLSEDEHLSSHKFTKMLKAMAKHKNLIYDDNSTGGGYYFTLTSKDQENGKG